jgi:hypothetical protein
MENKQLQGKGAAHKFSGINRVQNFDSDQPTESFLEKAFLASPPEP